MIVGRFTARELLRRTVALLRPDLGSALFAVVVLTGIALAIAQRPNAALLDILPFLASIYFQYDLTTRALARLDLLKGYRTRRLVALLGLILMTRLPLLAGFLLLAPAIVLRSPLILIVALIVMIVPSLFLLVRWFVAVPVLIVEEASALESLRIGWEETEGRFRPILVAALILYFPPYPIAIAANLLAGPNSTAASVAINGLFYASLVAGWYAAVAAYVMRRGGSEGLTEIFA